MSKMDLIRKEEGCFNSRSRFVSIELRHNESDLPGPFWEHIARNSCYIDWQGIPIQKDAFQIVTTQQLIQELQPKTIIEFGSFKGGSALWLADILTLCVNDGRVISTDIDLNNIDPKVRLDQRIEFIQGDSFHIEKMFPQDKIATLQHPILVIEDAHVNTSGILDYFHQHLFKAGDYFIVEDTNIDYNNACYPMWIKEFDADYCDKKLDNLNGKIINLKQWLDTHNGSYMIDTKYVDPFGITNATKNWNSVIKKVK